MIQDKNNENFPFFNRSFDKKRLKMLFSWYYANRGEAATFSLVETLQKLGFTYAMKAGISLGVDDLKVPATKVESLTEAVELLKNTKASVNSGNVTALEEFQQFVDTWHRTSENLKTSVVQNFSRNSLNFYKKKKSKPEKTEKSILFDQSNSKSSEIKNKTPFFESTRLFPYQSEKTPKKTYSTILNPVYMMAFSGARGNLSQVRQLVGMRGLMADPQGQLVEFPIQSNFREGLTVTEYMISCYGARKGLVDTALRTAAAGYLTRRLVDVSHHQIVRFVTCSTKSGILLSNGHNKKEHTKDNLLPSAWKVPPDFSKKKTTNKILEKKEKKAPLVFCVGRVLARDIPGYAFRNQEIDISLAASPFLKKIYDTVGIYIRSPLTCKAETGICQLCYGWSVSANRLVGLGEAVGIIAAQSIGEPGTQLTMRTFHTGGVFSGDIMEECRAKHSGVVSFQNIYLGLLVRTAGGAIAFCLKTSAIFQIKGINETTTYTVSPNTLLFVRQGEKVIMDSLLAQIPNLPTVEESTGESTKTILSDLAGEVRQKATVNPELASIRILAGQQCRQFYFFNSSLDTGVDPTETHPSDLVLGKGTQSSVLAEEYGLSSIMAKREKPSYFPSHEAPPNKVLGKALQTRSLSQRHSLFLNNNNTSFPSMLREKQLISTNSLNNSAQILKSTIQNLSPPLSFDLDLQGKKSKNKILSTSFFKNKKTKGKVNLMWGIHRLGSNKTCAININGYSDYILPKLKNSSPKSFFDVNNIHSTNFAYSTEVNQKNISSLPIKNIGEVKDKFHYQPDSNFLEVEESHKKKGSFTRNFLESALLVNLRFVVASKLHQNKFLGLSFLFENTEVTLCSDYPNKANWFDPCLVLVGSKGLALLNDALCKSSVVIGKSVPKASEFSSALLLMHRKNAQYKNQSIKSFLIESGIYKISTSEKLYINKIEKPTFSLKLLHFFELQEALQEQAKIKISSDVRQYSADVKLKKFFKIKKKEELRVLRNRKLRFNNQFETSGVVDGHVEPQSMIVAQQEKQSSVVANPYYSKSQGYGLRKNSIFTNTSFSRSFNFTKLPSKNRKFIFNNIPALKKLSTLTGWSESPNMLEYAHLFWKLEDLLFFSSNLTKKTENLYQFRVSINKHWWGNKKLTNPLLGRKVLPKKTKGILKQEGVKSHDIELNVEPQSSIVAQQQCEAWASASSTKLSELTNFFLTSKIQYIKDFPNLILKLFSFNFSKFNGLNSFFEEEQRTKEDKWLCLSSRSFNEFYTKSSKPRLKFQDSSEIFPLQGNTNLKEFQKKFSSFQNVTALNSGLLTHYNRISYRVPLCVVYEKASLFDPQINNPVLIKEQLSLLRSELAVFASHKNTGVTSTSLTLKEEDGELSKEEAQTSKGTPSSEPKGNGTIIDCGSTGNSKPSAEHRSGSSKPEGTTQSSILAQQDLGPSKRQVELDTPDSKHISKTENQPSSPRLSFLETESSNPKGVKGPSSTLFARPAMKLRPKLDYVLVVSSKYSRQPISNWSKESQLEKRGNKQNKMQDNSLTLFDNTTITKQTGIPQIGDFINSGDEIIKECASAYCGQIIEKSPLGLTLRLTQNILYSNLRNRPAKINKNVNNGNWIGKGAPLVTLPYISNVTGDIVAGIPKIEQLFEARGEALDDTVEKIWTSVKFSVVPRSKAVRECFKEIGLFVVAAIQKVYSSQGVHIADKHLEVIIRQMTRRALIVDPGDTEFLPEEFVDLNTIECVNWATYGDNAIYRPRLIGITKASLTSNSFLSSASFQQTARVLERETILEKTDRLLGLKERVMMGALINAGTGELKTSVRLSDLCLAKSLSSKLFERLSFFSRRKIRTNKKTIFKG